MKRRIEAGNLSTAGIGENSAAVRAGIAARLAWLGAILDAKANAAHASRISAPESRIALYVIPTNEELMIARHTMATLSAKAFNDALPTISDARVGQKSLAAASRMM